MDATMSKPQVIQAYLSSVGKNDIETVTRLVDPNFTHEFLGSTVFNTKKRDLADNRDMMQAFSEALVGDAIFTVHETMEEGDRVAAFFSSSCELKSGKRYDGVYAASFLFRDNRILSMRELMDTKLADSVMA